MQGIRCIINCTTTVATVTISNTTLLWSDPKAWPSGVIPVEGDAVEIIGDQQTMEDFASKMETIPYEVMTSFSRRVHRVYIES